MNDLTSELRELANVDAHSAPPVGAPFVPGGVPNAFYPPLTGSGIELRVIRDGTPARRLRINATRCTFGSGDGCTVRLNDSSLHTLHAVILREADRVLIRSHTGAIEVNGQLTSESLLECGDVFRLGSYVFETLSLPQSPAADSAQDQAQRLRLMTTPDPELEAARLRDQATHQRLAEALQRCEQAESQLSTANQAVADLQQQLESLSQQVEALVAETQTQQADADAQAAELRRLVTASEQAEVRSRAAVDAALQQQHQALQQAAELQQQLEAALRDAATLKQQHAAAVRERAEALQQRDVATRERDAAVRDRGEAVRQRDAAQQQAQTAQQQLDLAQQQRDQALQQRNVAQQQRDEALQQRDKAIARRSDAIDSEQAAQAKLRQLNQQILQLQQAQAAAESERLNELSLEDYMSRLLQQMERAPAAPAPVAATHPNFQPEARESHPPHMQPQPQRTAAVAAFADDAADEPHERPADAGSVAAQGQPTMQSPQAAEQPLRRPTASVALPPPAPPRPSLWSGVLQVAVVFSCSLIFFYCGHRNHNLQVVWYTASALAAGLVVFAVSDLLAKSLRRANSTPLPGRQFFR